MSSGRCLVFERTGAWAMALRRELADTGTRLVETRTWDQFIAELAAAPASVACLESVGLRPDEWVRRLARLHDDFPFSRVVMFAEGGACEDELVWRDLGVVEVVRSRRDLAATCLIVRRHVRSAAADESMRARLFRRLPWADASEDVDDGQQNLGDVRGHSPENGRLA